MKKLFTLLAFLAVVMGAKADAVEDYKIDYSTYNGFPFYVMGYVPEWVNGVMTDYGAMYTYKTEDNLADEDNVIGEVTTQDGKAYKKIQLESAGWHQYFIADGIKTELDGAYTVKAMVKASETVTVNVNMGWGWSDGQQAAGSVTIPQSDDFVEVEWEYSGIGGTSCNLVAQPGTATATIEWKSLIVSHDQKEVRPVTWQEWLTSDGQPVIVETKVEDIPTWMGNAETPWADPNVKFNDQENNYLICAWSKEKGRNMNDDQGWDPFPADIEVDPKDPNNKVFVCHGQPATTEGDASAWDNQFWIQSPKSWKAGTQVKVHFRYMCDYTGGGVETETQIHKQNPSDYLIWHAVGNITFTQEWQEYDDVMTIGDDMANGWSIAFNLNAKVKDAVNFYFDDLCWETMKLDEGLYIASANTTTGLAYDFDTATEFVWDDGLGAYVATVGTVGKQDTWVNEVMISTTRGNDAAFKSATLKPSGSYIGEDNWGDYTESSLAKIKLAAGVWKVAVDTELKQMNFVQLEGEAAKEAEDIITNETEVIVKALEREYTEAEAEAAGIEKPETPGQAWDNQFWIKANRVLEAGEVTVVKFQYKASKAAKVSTQTHAQPGGYIHWAAIGDVNFTEEWQDFEAVYTIPSEAAGKDAQSIAFNMAEIKEACDYELKNFQWYLQYDEEGKTSENLIDKTGTKNLYVKIVGGATEEYNTGSETDGINSVVTNNNASAVIYNLAGQRVDNGYKGIVVKSGKKVMMK